MSTPNDGGPAFPNQSKDIAGMVFPWNGMSLRDYFAAAVLTGVSGSHSGDLMTYYDLCAGSRGDNDLPSPRAVSRYAYELADAMLAERAKGGGK